MVQCCVLQQMGLGKTAQSISTLEFQRQLCNVAGPFLIVAPLTTLGHWQREVETWTPMVSSSDFQDQFIGMLCVGLPVLSMTGCES